MKSFYLLLAFFLLLNCEVYPTNSTYRRYPSTSNVNESAEFKNLMENDQINKNAVNAEVLNYLLNDSSPSEKNTAIVIENNSRCNIIVKITGISKSKIYNLPVYANSKNQFIIEKGNYTLRSNVCNAKYYSQKSISDVFNLKLSN